MSQINETGIPSGLSLSASPPRANESGPDWERFCKELLAERDKIRAELQEVKKERELYRKALQATLPVEETHFTKDEILAQRGKRPPLQTLISELEKELSA
jgi:hypothetical protein